MMSKDIRLFHLLISYLFLPFCLTVLPNVSISFKNLRNAIFFTHLLEIVEILLKEVEISF